MLKASALVSAMVLVLSRVPALLYYVMHFEVDA